MTYDGYSEEGSASFEVHWRIEDYKDPESGYWLFYYSCPAVEVEERLRRAIREFVKTEDGMAAIESECGQFNWGDAVNHIPEEWWNRYGLSFPRQPHSDFEIQVDHDESFVDEE
jgi:hypothetical protein